MPPDPLDAARRLVLRYGWNAMAYQILNPGISYWFAPDGDAVVGYATAGGYRVVGGVPVCARDRLLAVAEAFIADTRAAGERVCFFGTERLLLDWVRARGPATVLPLGAQPVWDPAHLAARFRDKGSLRAQLARARNKGVVVERWGGARAQGHPALEACLRGWLETRGLPPMHFLVEWDVLARPLDRHVYVALRDGAVVAYTVLSPVPLRQGWLVEQTVRGADAPNGTAELLLDHAARDVAAEGAAYLTLGLAPLARTGAPTVGLPAAVRLLLAWVRVHGRRFYNFEGLEQYKRKFEADHWEPIYAIAEGAGQEIRVLYAVTGVFGGASPVRFLPRALTRAVRQEARWLRDRLRRAP
ncbi:MAG TPA: DUF2156 domain-containing protein [Rhodothermales bacterium]|nr:DUF2156 domain-containing protein [Rhodothermales bacterium]